jgi:6-phosphogluconolactonase
MRHERRFDAPDAMAAALAFDLAARLRADLADRGRASLIVSGGRTPIRLFARLAHAALDWRRVSISLADERLVPPTHRQSNARFVSEHLLQDRAAAARFFSLWPGSGDPLASAAAALKRLPRPFTAVILGIGEDGHTASLFPDAPGLARALDPEDSGEFIEVPATENRKARLSLTLRVLCDTPQVVLIFEGAAKRRIFEEALKPRRLDELPVRAILRQKRAAVDVYWSAGMS